MDPSLGLIHMLMKTQYGETDVGSNGRWQKQGVVNILQVHGHVN
jgi:hypothetical protein